MNALVKHFVILSLGSMSSVACAQPATPTPEPAQPALPAQAAEGPAPQAAKIRAEIERATEQARRANDEARRAGAEARRSAFRSFTIATPGGKKEKVAFLGVSTSSVEGALRKNLNIARGTGLVVETVYEKSPSADAGVQQYDILLKLDDQILVNEKQLGVLVRLKKAGDEVNLSVLREGKTESIKVKLAEKEMYVSDATGESESPIHGSFSAVAGMPLSAEAPIAIVDAVPADLMGKLHELKLLTGETADANSIFQDQEMTLIINKKDGEKHLLAKDKDGKMLFDGPIDNDEQRKAMPDAVSKKLEKFEENIKTIPGADHGDVNVRVLTK